MIAVEEFNDCLKKQISMNNNHFSTLENCLKYFSRSNQIMKYNRVKRPKTKWSAESKENESLRAKQKLLNRDNYIIKPKLVN